MAYFKPTIDKTGLHLPTYQEVLDYLNERTRAIYGNDIYLEPDSQDYQANAEVADLWMDMANLVQQTYNNRAIQTAQGVSIDGLLKINGLKRLSASHSIAIVTIVGEAEDGKEAIEKYKELNPDIVTLDLAMLDHDGIEALREIKQHDPDAKVVVVSSTTDQEAVVDEVLDLGALVVLNKPIVKDDLVATLLDIINE